MDKHSEQLLLISKLFHFWRYSIVLQYNNLMCITSQFLISIKTMDTAMSGMRAMVKKQVRE